MAQYDTTLQFHSELQGILGEEAAYHYKNFRDGYLAARELQTALNRELRRIAEIPLLRSMDWGNPQRKSLWDYGGNQYALIFFFEPPSAEENNHVTDILFFRMYSTHTNENQPQETHDFDADDLLKD